MKKTKFNPVTAKELVASVKSLRHTPGPWTTNSEMVSSENGFVAKVASSGLPGLEWEANARLIAASPDLLETVKMWRKFWDTMPKGQMGKLAFDVGLFNDALIATSKSIAKAESIG